MYSEKFLNYECRRSVDKQLPTLPVARRKVRQRKSTLERKQILITIETVTGVLGVGWGKRENF